MTTYQRDLARNLLTHLSKSRAYRSSSGSETELVTDSEPEYYESGKIKTLLAAARFVDFVVEHVEDQPQPIESDQAKDQDKDQQMETFVKILLDAASLTNFESNLLMLAEVAVQTAEQQCVTEFVKQLRQSENPEITLNERINHLSDEEKEKTKRLMWFIAFSSMKDGLVLKIMDSNKDYKQSLEIITKLLEGNIRQDYVIKTEKNKIRKLKELEERYFSSSFPKTIPFQLAVNVALIINETSESDQETYDTRECLDTKTLKGFIRSGLEKIQLTSFTSDQAEDARPTKQARNT